ncbi:hypothetical protein Tco_0198770 [Tanacetum coccineum]
MDTELMKGSKIRTEGSSKRAGEELESENLKKQKLDENVEAEVDDDQEEAEMKKHMEIVPDDDVFGLRLFIKKKNSDVLNVSNVNYLETYLKTSILHRLHETHASLVIESELNLKVKEVADTEDSDEIEDKQVQPLIRRSISSSKGTGIIPKVLDEPKDISGCSSNLLSGSDDKVENVSSDDEIKANENKVKTRKSVEEQAEEDHQVDDKDRIKHVGEE